MLTGKNSRDAWNKGWSKHKTEAVLADWFDYSHVTAERKGGAGQPEMIQEKKENEVN